MALNTTHGLVVDDGGEEGGCNLRLFLRRAFYVAGGMLAFAAVVVYSGHHASAIPRLSLNHWPAEVVTEAPTEAPTKALTEAPTTTTSHLDNNPQQDNTSHDGGVALTGDEAESVPYTPLQLPTNNPG